MTTQKIEVYVKEVYFIKKNSRVFFLQRLQYESIDEKVRARTQNEVRRAREI